MGDALATYFEARACQRSEATSRAEGDTLHNMPFTVTPESVFAAIKAADAYGRYYLREE